MTKKVNDTFWDNFGYYVAVILTFGGAWFAKCIYKKAIVDSFKK